MSVGNEETRPELVNFLDEKYESPVGFEIQRIDGTVRYVIVRTHCITAMKKFESNSLEELRMEYYKINRKPVAVGFFGDLSSKSSPFLKLTDTSKPGARRRGFIEAKEETKLSLTYQPPIGADVQLINGTKHFVTTRKQCITAMEEYESKSMEELRMEYYDGNQKFAAAFAESTDASKWSSMRSSLFPQAKQKRTSSSLEPKETFNIPFNDKVELVPKELSIHQEKTSSKPQEIDSPNDQPNAISAITDRETISTSSDSEHFDLMTLQKEETSRQRHRSNLFSDTQQRNKAELNDRPELFPTKFITSNTVFPNKPSRRWCMTHYMSFALFLGLILSISLNLYFLFRINK